MNPNPVPPVVRWLAAAAIWFISSGIGLHAAGSPALSDAAPKGIIFVVRKPGSDPHWYANFGKYAPDRLAESPVFTRGASLRRLDQATGAVTVLLDDPQGGIRDPQVHHDGNKILFSYRPGNSEHYRLHEIGFSFWMPDLKDRRIRRNRHLVFNLTRPDQSLMLLAPLARAAGGLGTCREPGLAPGDGTVFSNSSDPDYQVILAMCDAGKRRLDEVKRFDMPGFRPRREWIAEMKRFGVLPASFNEASDPVDPYATEQAYWRSLWPVPSE